MGSRKIKVLHIIPVLAPGGVERAAVDTLDLLLAEGVDLTVVALKGTNHSHQIDPNKRAICLNSNFVINVFKVIFLIRRSSPDLIIASLWPSALLCLLAKPFLPAGIALVHFTHSQVYFGILDRMISSFSYSAFPYLLADCKESASAVTRRSGLVPQIVDYIIKPSNLDQFVNQLKDFSASGMYAGRMLKSKGIYDILTFISRMKSANCNFRCDFYGLGDDKVLDDFLAHADELGVRDLVNYRGHFNSSRFAQVAQPYTFCLMLSHAEGMAMSVVDAMQCGLIPIANPVGEMKNYIEHGVNGFHYPLADQEQMARCERQILYVLSDAEALTELGARAKGTFSNRKDYATSLATFIKSVVNS